MIEWVENPWQVQIPWVESFDVRGQSTASNIQINNGISSVQTQLQLQLQSRTTGSFVLGPARVTSAQWTIESNALTITVTGSKIFLQPQGITQAWTQEVADTEDVLLDEKKSLFSWWYRLLLGIGGIGVVVFFYAKKKRTTVVVQKDSMAQEQPLPEMIPQYESVTFREEVDIRIRIRLGKYLAKDVTSCSYGELMNLASSLPTAYTEKLAIIVQSLELQLYTDKESDRNVVWGLLHDLAYGTSWN